MRDAFKDIVSDDEMIMRSIDVTIDGLTGLLNRRGMQLRLGELNSDDAVFSLLNIDSFHVLNDVAGKDVADSMLRRVGNALVNRFGNKNVARLDGDNFIVIANPYFSEQLGEVSPYELLAGALHDCYSLSLTCNAGSFWLRLSAGFLSISPGDQLDDLLVNASSACRKAKLKGGSRVMQYEPASQSSYSGSLSLWASRVMHAVNRGGFELYVQPIVDAEQAVSYHEVLVRMNVDGDIVGPGYFMPAARTFRLTRDIDLCVVSETFKFISEHNYNGRLAINLTPETLESRDSLAAIRSAADVFDINGEQIIFELTEENQMGDLDEARFVLDELRRDGYHISLDDFGSGTAGLRQLRYLPVDTIKIDGAFIKNIVNSETDAAIVAAVVDIAKKTGKDTVCEFIESEEAFDTLRSMGVDKFQGYYFSPPVTIETLIESRKRA